MLALIVDGSIAMFEWGLRRRPSRGSRFKATIDRSLRPVALLMPVLLIVAGCFAYFSTSVSSSNPAWGPFAAEGRSVRIGTKNFTEQLVLGELLAQLIEARTDLRAERRFNLGGTMICHGALKSGEIDLCAE